MAFAVFQCLLAILTASSETTWAQGLRDVQPVVGLRENPPTGVLLQNANFVSSPDFYHEHAGQASNLGDVLIREGAIVQVDEAIDPPPGCRTIDCRGKTLYAGWINAWHEVGAEHVTPAEIADDYWNANVVANRRIRELSEVPDAAKLRSQGFTTSVVAPRGRILGGTPSVWSLNQSDANSSGPQRIGETPWMTAAITVPRPNDAAESYPRSPMGALALLRQALYDAKWYRDAVAAYQANPTLPQPKYSSTLSRLALSLSENAFVFDCPNERMILRSRAIAKEFSIQSIVRGSGREYRDIENVVNVTDIILLPINFPEAPNVSTPEQSREVELRDLMHWKWAPANPANLIEHGITVCLATDRLKDISQFLPNLRKAVDHGLSRRDAIASLTTNPAKLLGIDQTHGRIETGMVANLILADGDLFKAKTKILKVFVGGQELEVNAEAARSWEAIVGDWQIPKARRSNWSAELNIKQSGGRVSAELVLVNADIKEAVKKEDTAKVTNRDKPRSKRKKNRKRKQLDGADRNGEKDKEDEPQKPITIDLNEIVQRSDQIAAMLELGEPSKDWCDEMRLPLGKHRVTIRPTGKSFENSGEELPLILEVHPVGMDSRSFSTKRANPKQDKIEVQETDDSDTKSEGNSAQEPDEESDSQPVPFEKIKMVHPLGVYGRENPVSRPSRILFRSALVWTCEDRSDLSVPIEPKDVLIENGRIVAVEKRIQVDPNEKCLVIDARGKHLTPGLVDCHSHIATDGGINEAGQVVTSEVRIGDFLDETDITIYRQLAGGVTTANILHGSANPIGGQNQVIKFRWGDSMEDLRFSDAPAGIKFALGENVKRLSTRYPNSRMGVEQLLRDQLLAAREYHRMHRRWNAGERNMLPPRVDLQLQAIAEIQNGERWIHCHSYRQDEIVATLDVLEEFGIQIGSLQHILEGYKVAGRMARHGAMASTFADWWAYKFEVYDAIPYNGAVMHDAGIVVSFNSDDWEMGRHLNTEAAKAVKYGGVSQTEALKLVTLNPAKQLRIENRVGSIEVGKDADLVLWSGPPLSTMSRCEQTWIDGRPMFDIKDDFELRTRDESWRQELIQEILDGEPKLKTAKSAKEVPSEEDRWLRYDEFCNSRGGQQDSLAKEENQLKQDSKTIGSGDSR